MFYFSLPPPSSTPSPLRHLLCISFSFCVLALAGYFLPQAGLFALCRSLPFLMFFCTFSVFTHLGNFLSFRLLTLAFFFCLFRPMLAFARCRSVWLSFARFRPVCRCVGGARGEGETCYELTFCKINKVYVNNCNKIGQLKKNILENTNVSIMQAHCYLGLTSFLHGLSSM